MSANGRRQAGGTHCSLPACFLRPFHLLPDPAFPQPASFARRDRLPSKQASAPPATDTRRPSATLHCHGPRPVRASYKPSSPPVLYRGGAPARSASPAARAATAAFAPHSRSAGAPVHTVAPHATFSQHSKVSNTNNPPNGPAPPSHIWFNGTPALITSRLSCIRREEEYVKRVACQKTVYVPK